jgi:hypothetical protein
MTILNPVKQIIAGYVNLEKETRLFIQRDIGGGMIVVSHNIHIQ